MNDQVISLMEGDRASLDSLTMPLQIRPSHKRAWATYGREGPGTKPIPSKKGGLEGGTVTVAVEMLGESNAENTTTK